MILIINANIVSMGKLDYECGYIMVDKGRIISAGDMLELDDKAVKESQVIDAKGLFVLPGFVDAHNHLGLIDDAMGFEGDDLNEMTDPITPHLRAIDGIYNFDRGFEEARNAGVTTVVTGPGSANVIGGQFAAVKTYGARVEDMILKHPAAMKIAFGENPKTVYSKKRETPMTRMATAGLLRENLMKAIDYKQQLDDYKNDSDKNKKPEYNTKLESLIKVLNGELIVKAHAHRADDILTALRIADEFSLKMTIEHCTEGHLIKDILKKEGASAIVGPLLTDRSKIELKNQSLKLPGILSSAGIKVAIMTDHPCVPVQYLSLCAAMAVREGMDEYEALKAVTINAAEICGINDRVGSIDIGKDADIIILNGPPLELKTRVVLTMINGVKVYEAEQNS